MIAFVDKERGTIRISNHKDWLEVEPEEFEAFLATDWKTQVKEALLEKRKILNELTNRLQNEYNQKLGELASVNRKIEGSQK